MPGTRYLGYPGYGPGQLHCLPLYALEVPGVVYDPAEPSPLPSVSIRRPARQTR